jgi:hypothetical protein
MDVTLLGQQVEAEKQPIGKLRNEPKPTMAKPFKKGSFMRGGGFCEDKTNPNLRLGRFKKYCSAAAIPRWPVRA